LSRIFVTGLGAISAIGENVSANRRALGESICGITTLTLFPSRFCGTLPAGEIRISTEALKDRLKAHIPGITRTSLLAIQAFEEAIADSGLSKSTLTSTGTALVSGGTVGGMCLTDELFNDANKDTNGSEYLSSYDCSSVNLLLQSRYEIKGIINTINSACSSSANAIMYGARLIKNGFARRAIVGGVDSLAKYTVNGFNALHILSPEKCAPFDRSRSGLNLGEGAAFLVLEKEEDVQNKKVYAELAGYCNTNDAFHPSSLSAQGDGPYLAMKGALLSANLQTAQIGFINAHGTGTENNDLVESTAILRLFETAPPFASTKSNTGHTLGAAGALEALYSILNLHYQEVYPGLNFRDPIEETGLRPEQVYRSMQLEHVMSNSFGFGGNCTSLIFSKA
jgi:3-oxoacyl-(acyl-carrier-protein) synthase